MASKNQNMETEAEEALHPLNPDLVQVLVKNHRQFQSFLAKRVESKAVAEDLLQQSLKKALETPPNSQKETSIVAWFYQVLKNTMTDYYRSHAAEEKKSAEFFQALMTHGKSYMAPLDEVEAAVCKCMEGLLPTLKGDYAALIRRIDLEDQSLNVVAKELGITENNLRVRLHRARQALKIGLQRTCGTCTEHGCLNCTCE
jgi:RNA polymerase sigma factor (sigma-70 family)